MKKLKEIQILLIFILGIFVLLIFYNFEWSGFGKTAIKSVAVEEVLNPISSKPFVKVKKEVETFQPSKTFWDWLGLAGTLAIPLVILRFQQVDKERSIIRAEIESQKTFENLREEAVIAYFDRIANLLVHKDYRAELFLHQDLKDIINNPIKEIACANTVMILRRLKNDTERQNQVLFFLKSTKLFNFILVNSNLSKINLYKTDLSNACLTRADLSNADLTEAKLFEANLSRSNLSKATLIAADLRSSNLSRAEFCEAKLSEAQLSDSNLSEANLRGVELRNLKLNNTNLSGANLSMADLSGADLSGANLSMADLSGADLSSANLTDTDFRGANLKNTVFTQANLLQAQLIDTKNFTLEQVKDVSQNWDTAEYDLELQNQLS